jgi:hypothetical protein
MPEPSLNAVHVNRPLTMISQAYLQDARMYIADKVFPVVPVSKQSDRYFIYTKGDWFRDQAQIRAPATESAGGGYGLDNTPTYYCPVYAYHKDVDDQVRSNSDDPLNADRDATMFVTERMLMSRERQAVNIFFTTSTWTGSSTGGDITPGTLWSAANSTPLEDIETQIWAIEGQTGKFPNRLVLGATVWKILKNHSEIIERIKYTQRGINTPEILASLIAPPGVNDFQVLVAAAIYNTAEEGATDSFTWIAPTKSAVLLYSPAEAGIQVPASGYNFTWTGLLGAGAFGSVISTIPMPFLGRNTVRIEGELAFVTKIVGADLGAYFLNAVA